MKKSITLTLCFILLLVMVGCYLGDRHSLTRKVLLNFQDRAATDAGLSHTNIEVQEALKIIDTVLITRGFVGEARTDMENAPGFVASYVRYENSGLRLGIRPEVFLTRSRIEVEIVELGNRTTHPTVLTDEICGSLRRELSSRYGSGNVKVHNGHL